MEEGKDIPTIPAQQPQQAQTTAVAPLEKNTALGQELAMLFSDINFTGLRTAIEKMADGSKELTTDEKKVAVDLVKEWETDVVKRLSDYRNKVNGFLDYFASGSEGYYFTPDEDAMEELALRTNSIREYEAYVEAKRVLDSFRKTRPEQPKRDDDVPYNIYLLKEREYQTKLTEYGIQEKRFLRASYAANAAWRKLVRESGEFSDLEKKLKKYLREFNKYVDNCRQNGKLARLNISISSAATRDSLKSLLDFAINL